MQQRAGVGERLVTVLLTLAVPQTADPEDAAALVADAAEGTALQVRHAVGVEGHLPAPGATVVRAGRRMPWQVVSVGVDTVRLRDLVGDVVEVSRRGVLPDPLEQPAGLVSDARPGVGSVVSGRRRPVPGQLSLLPGCLDAQDRAVLVFARDHHLQGRVGAHVQAQLGMTQTRYYQLLLRLLDRVEVAEAEPELVAGLVALHDGRRRRLARPRPAARAGSR